MMIPVTKGVVNYDSTQQNRRWAVHYPERYSVILRVIGAYYCRISLVCYVIVSQSGSTSHYRL
jgi:hypothetical protein